MRSRGLVARGDGKIKQIVRGLLIDYPGVSSYQTVHRMLLERGHAETRDQLARWRDAGTSAPRSNGRTRGKTRVESRTYVRAEDLKIGHFVAYDDPIHYRMERYEVEIVGGPEGSTDRFGRGMLKFKAKVVSGPDKHGETFDLILGPGGVIRSTR